ncbi:4809_t:CDS:2 [Ambispora gerdemannii]|uniref:4809_t:CDS:1 n=1 Tax=Ambispora gerdemannii TaxID=144530 RepID=A0A9N9EXZ8_9GLOM|nr:4809_t:CDS:2 [Ambispora gerdemannii]
MATTTNLTLDNDNSAPPTVWVSDECDFPGIVNNKLQGCSVHPKARYVYIVALIYASIILLTSLALSYYRIVFQCRLLRFPLSRRRGILRFRPLEAFQICAVSFALITIIDAICLLANLYPNTSWALVGGHLPFIVGFSLATLYPIVYSSSSADESLSKESIIYNKYLIDTIGFIFLIGPVITILPIRWIKGEYLMERNLTAAKIMAKWNTAIWSTWTILFLTVLWSFWLKLHTILKVYLVRLRERVLYGDEYRLQKISDVSKHAIVLSLTLLVIIEAGLTVFRNLYRKEDKVRMFFMVFDVFEGLIGIQFGQIIMFRSVFRSVPPYFTELKI